VAKPTIRIAIPFPHLPWLSVKVFLFEDKKQYLYHWERKWCDMRPHYPTAVTHEFNYGKSMEVLMHLPSQERGQCALSLAHECVHVVQFIDKIIGSQDDEWDAYNLAYLMETVFKRAPFMRTR
jgi:hypothetical protein